MNNVGLGKAVGLLVTGSLAGQAILLASTPIITRLYSPNELGLLAVYASLLTIIVTVASLRFEMAIPLPNSARRAQGLVALSVCLVLASAMVVAVVVTACGRGVSAAIGVDEFGSYIWLLPFGVVGAGLYQVFNYWAVRSREYHAITQTRVVQSICQTTAQVGLGIAFGGATSLIAGDVVGRTAGAGTLAKRYFAARRRIRVTRWPNWLLILGREYRAFPLLSAPAAAMNAAGLQLPAVLIAMMYSPALAGLFALSQRVMGLPMRFVGQSVGQAYLGEASHVLREQPGTLRRIFHSTARSLFAYGFLPIALVAAIGPWAFGTIFGSEWEASGSLVRILAPAYWSQLIVSPISQTTILAGRQGWQLCADAFRILVVALGFWGSHRFGLSGEAAVAVYSGTMVLTYMLYYAVAYASILTYERSHQVGA